MSHYKKMLVEDWIKVEDNPIQRDTEKHAAKAKHLHTPKPTHYFVAAAELPNGKLIKLDGHTRALMWERKEIPPPMQVNVAIIPVKNKEEAEELYKTYDAKDALETQRDKVSGAFRNHNFEPQSALLQSGNLTYALRIAYTVLLGLAAGSAQGGGPSNNAVKDSHNRAVSERRAKARNTDIYAMIDEFSYELHALDGFGLRQGQINAGTMSAFLLSYRRYGHKITPFWQGVFGNEGTKSDGKMDAIQAVCELILARRKHYGGQAATDMCNRTLMAVEKWLKDEMLYSAPRPLDTAGYLTGRGKPTERLIKRKDLEKAKIDRERAPA